MGPTDEKVGGRSATAFAPAHLTGVFVPALGARDPRARGSMGAGVALEVGAWGQARWTPGRARRVVVVGDRPGPLPISHEVADRLLGARRGTLRVELRHELPIGQGFGMSAAGALATGLAVSAVLGLPGRKAIEAAHLAELFGGGGLGGVAAILGSGLELRDRPGIPPLGHVRHQGWSGRIYLVTLGRPLPSPPLLQDAGFRKRVELAGADGLRGLGRNFTAARLFETAERFTDELGLAPERWQPFLQRWRKTGTRVAQAMLGRSLYAVPLNGPAERALLRELRPLRGSVIRVRGSHRSAQLVCDSPPVESGAGRGSPSARHRGRSTPRAAG